MPKRETNSFGISIEPTWNLGHSISLAKLAEKHGFSNVWVPDGGPASPFSDSIVTLATIAASTSKIKFGSSILNFYTRNPAQIASSFLALSDLGSIGNASCQRAILGIGVGSDYNVSKFGIFARQGMIVQLREAIESIQELFSGKEVSVRTDSFSIERVTLSKSKRKIPIYIGSQSPKGLKLAGEIADGVILTQRIASRVEDSLRHITFGLNSASRKRRDIQVINSAVISVARDKARAQNAAKTACTYLVAWLDDEIVREYEIDAVAKKKITQFLNNGDEISASRLVDKEMLELLTICGTPEECVEKCKEHLRYGVDQIAFCEPYGPDPKNAIQIIARNIIPRL